MEDDLAASVVDFGGGPKPSLAFMLPSLMPHHQNYHHSGHHHSISLAFKKPDALRLAVWLMIYIDLETGADGGHWGVELWLNLQQPIGYDGHTPIMISKQDVVVLHQDPRALINED